MPGLVTPCHRPDTLANSKLFLHLPCKVDDQNGKATWTNSTLKVVLPIIRELVV